MALARRVKLYNAGAQSMHPFPSLFQIFSFENKTDLASCMGMLGELKSRRHKRFANANAVELAEAELLSEAVHSPLCGHQFYYSINAARREYQFATPVVLYAVAPRLEIKSVQLKRILRGVAAMIIGYGVIVVLTSLGFNVVLGGRPIYGGSTLVLVGGMLVAVISGLAGGYVAGLIGPMRGLVNAMLVLIPLTIDTMFVLSFYKKSTAPFWFDAMASVTLMMFTLVGGFLSKRKPI
jgi:hypothetical protein